jgi:ribosomal protein L37AE/L43A
MEIVIALFVLVGGSIAFSAWKNSKSPENSPSVERQADQDIASNVRTCLACGYEGEMKVWLSSYTIPKLIAVAGFVLGYVPGLIFLAVYWGKYKCPKCGKVGKSQRISDAQ